MGRLWMSWFADGWLEMDFIMQFNCFLLMPIMDKLPALLREELENAFEDDLDSIFDITNSGNHLIKRNGEMRLN
ncbi:hypothetical protein F2Q69_00037873 [Brassica cretica]|uniref:Uncharacterized protein n=1 Tax=Brassica cretica TaxID=69181 RepID=A0A8S9SRZ3_BRACR|nr:hypothetical protein F2Q69_00037873 [Brassica cretica]